MKKMSKSSGKASLPAGSKGGKGIKSFTPGYGNGNCVSVKKGK